MFPNITNSHWENYCVPSAKNPDPFIWGAQSLLIREGGKKNQFYFLFSNFPFRGYQSSFIIIKYLNIKKILIFNFFFFLFSYLPLVLWVVMEDRTSHIRYYTFSIQIHV